MTGNRLEQITDSIAEEVLDLWWEQPGAFDRFTHIDRAMPAVAKASPRVLSKLVERLRDPYEPVRSRAAEAVGVMGSAAATETILDCLAELLRDDRDETGSYPVRNDLTRAAEAVARLGSAATTPAILYHLTNLLGTEDFVMVEGLKIYRSESRLIRRSAARAVGRLGEKAATEEIFRRLARMFRWGYTVKNAAVEAMIQLAKIASSELIFNCLHRCLWDKNGNVRCTAVRILPQLGSKAATQQTLECVTELLRDTEDLVRIAATEAVARLDKTITPEWICDQLSGWLQSGNVNLRIEVGGALLRIDRKEATAAFIERLSELLRVSSPKGFPVDYVDIPFYNNRYMRLQDSDPNVFSAVVSTISQLGSRAATDAIVNRLTKLLLRWSSYGQISGVWRCTAGAIVAVLGDAAATEPILDCLSKFLQDKDKSFRYIAASLVGRIGSTAANTMILRHLVKLLSDEKAEVRKVAVETFGRLGSAAATPEILGCLADLLRDESAEIRQAGAKVVLGLGKAAATPVILSRLTELLRDELRWRGDYNARYAAIHAIGQMGSAAATSEILGCLAQLLEDTTHNFPPAVAEAVGGIGVPAATPTILKRLVRLRQDEAGNPRRAAGGALESLMAQGLRVMRGKGGMLVGHTVDMLSRTGKRTDSDSERVIQDTC